MGDVESEMWLKNIKHRFKSWKLKALVHIFCHAYFETNSSETDFTRYKQISFSVLQLTKSFSRELIFQSMLTAFLSICILDRGKCPVWWITYFACISADMFESKAPVRRDSHLTFTDFGSLYSNGSFPTVNTSSYLLSLVSSNINLVFTLVQFAAVTQMSHFSRCR